ncbi:Longitudinals lacking protein-like, partial [Caligus rogercresseyi]
MGSLTQEVYVHWNEFASHFQEGFCELRESQELFDITLAASGSKQIRAHKVILSACSSFFRGLLRVSPQRSIPSSTSRSILSFIYNGEVKVQQGELESLLAVARELQIKGLTKNLSPETKQNVRRHHH